MYYVSLFLEKSEYDFMVFECNTIDLARIVRENANIYKYAIKVSITGKLLNLKNKKVYFRNFSNSPKWYHKDYLNGYRREEY